MSKDSVAVFCVVSSLTKWADPEGVGVGVDRASGPPGKSQVAKGFLRNSDTNPLEKHLYPWVKSPIDGGLYDPLRKTLMTEKMKKISRTP